MSKLIKIGLLGLGTVGSTFVQKLQKSELHPMVAISKILLLNPSKKRNIDTSSYILTTDPNEILNDPDINIVIELIGGEQPALNFIIQAIKSQKVVITANKCVMALHGKQLIELAAQYNTPILYEASVAGGIPIIRTIMSSLQSITTNSFIGICNGTTNFILSQMLSNKVSFQDALKEAQEQGFAEADPILDIAGIDAAYKASILSSLCFKHFQDFSQIHIEGIMDITLTDLEAADHIGYRIKSIIYAKKVNHVLQVGVFLALISKNNLLSHIEGVDNLIQLNSEYLGKTTYIGPGAGGDATSTSVISDLINVINNPTVDLSYYEKCTKSYSYGMVNDIDFNFFITISIEKDDNMNEEQLNDFKLLYIDEISSSVRYHHIDVNNIFFNSHSIKSQIAHMIIITGLAKNNEILRLCENLMKLDKIKSCSHIRMLS